MTRTDPPTLVGAVLAGGGSRRMGRDKRTIPWDESTLLERAVELLRPLVSDVVILGELGEDVRPPPGARVLVDRSRGAGPAAALRDAVAMIGAPLLVIPCDMPLLTQEPLALLKGAYLDADKELGRGVVAECDGRLQPALGIHTPTATGAITDDLRDTSLRALAQRAGASVVSLPRNLAPQLVNVNTPEELEAARRSDRGRGEDGQAGSHRS